MVVSDLGEEITGTETEKQLVSNNDCLGRDVGQNSP